MAYTDWQWGRIRARLITYYYHQKEDLNKRVEMRAYIKNQQKAGASSYIKSYTENDDNSNKVPDISTKEGRLSFLKVRDGKPKQAFEDISRDESEGDDGPNNSIALHTNPKEQRDSAGWLIVAFNILKSDTNKFKDPGSWISVEKEKPDKNWDIKGESLRRYYTGDKSQASRNTGGLVTRTIPRPRRDVVEIAIHDFLHSIGYLDKSDLEEPDNWVSPDKALMDEMGLSQKELRKSKIPHMLSRDYISHSSNDEKFATALMSIYTRYTHHNCKVRYITQENFRTNSSNQHHSNKRKDWKWFWGWLLFDADDTAIVKVIEDSPFEPLHYSFWLNKFKYEGDKKKDNSTDIIAVSMTTTVEFHAAISDQRLVELMRESYSSKRAIFRDFILSKLKSLTYILNSYRFIKKSEERLPVAGYAEQVADDHEQLELSQLNERLATIVNSRTRKIMPFEGRGNDMSEGDTYYSGVILHEEPGMPRHVMNLTLDEVVKENRLGERLIYTVRIGFPWHIDELIQLDADPDYVSLESGACALHFMAWSSANGHLNEFTNAVKKAGKSLKFNVKANNGHLPSDTAAQYCVNP